MISLLRSYSTIHSAFTRRQTAADLTRELSQAQQELSSGRKADVFRDLGVAAAESLNLRATKDRDEAQIGANKLLSNRMETMAQTLGTIRETVSEALQLAVASKTSPGGTVSALQETAKAALQSLISQTNGSHGGVPLFSGTNNAPVALQAWNKDNPGSGVSPADVLADIMSGGLASVTDAQNRIAELDAAFSDSATPASRNFEQTFYNGAAAGDPRQEAPIGDGTVLAYGVQANDQAFRDVIQGLAMLASTDPAQIDDPEAYRTWVGAATDKLSSGNTGLLDAETLLGAQAAQIEETNTRMQDRIDLYQSRILDLEGVDSYEAATRITLLETQLQASYAVTARLSQLSFLNYMY